MNVSVPARFLWLPIRRTSHVVKLHFLSGGTKFQEMDISLSPDHPEYYAALDLGKHVGSLIEIRGDLPDDLLMELRFHDAPPDPDDSRRPRIHFDFPSIGHPRGENA